MKKFFRSPSEVSSSDEESAVEDFDLADHPAVVRPSLSPTKAPDKKSFLRVLVPSHPEFPEFLDASFQADKDGTTLSFTRTPSKLFTLEGTKSSASKKPTLKRQEHPLARRKSKPTCFSKSSPSLHHYPQIGHLGD